MIIVAVSVTSTLVICGLTNLYWSCFASNGKLTIHLDVCVGNKSSKNVHYAHDCYGISIFLNIAVNKLNLSECKRDWLHNSDCCKGTAFVIV